MIDLKKMPVLSLSYSILLESTSISGSMKDAMLMMVRGKDMRHIFPSII